MVCARHLLPSICLLVAVLGPPLSAQEGRAVWLTRWHATTEEQIVSCLDGMSALGANMLFCQVYGDGMALYASSLVPRSPLVAAGFDSLAVAVEEGHARGIEVHAYINTCNVYSGGLGTPDDARHLVRAHPEWAVVDVNGRSDIENVGTADAMVFFCPEWEGFRAHCAAVASEIVANYDVDGIHLDYSRFPGGTARCFCEAHVEGFRDRFGRDPEHSDPDFIEMRYQSIERLFADIYDAATEIRPLIKVSASLATSGDRYFQDAQRILEAGKLDIGVPLCYTDDLGAFTSWIRSFHELSGGRHVFAGINVATSGAGLGGQIAAARDVGLEGQALFTWSTIDAAAEASIAALYADAAQPPAMPWKDGTLDTVSPVISGVAASGILADEATVRWHTDERAEGWVEYGPSSALGSTAAGASQLFDHAVRLTGLTPLTTYHFRAAASDAAGNTARSPVATFRTASGGPVVVTVDDRDEGFTNGGPWSSGSSPGGNDGDYLFSSDQPVATAWAEFRPFLPRQGDYEVSIWYVAGTNRVTDASFTVVHADGHDDFFVDQKQNGQRWNVLGTFPFLAGAEGYVRLTNQASGGDVVIADAVRFELISGEPSFIRGDANQDGRADISDAVAILGYLFLGSAEPDCFSALDADDSGHLVLTDAVYVLNRLFLGGAPIPDPHPECGADPSPDGLSCGAFAPCAR
ncbi:MAG: family 10 glycosylhydrolase [Planctomycetes bacterium]|nr:family 10 glycosylhydrolase [Planctomycetota bacterium]